MALLLHGDCAIRFTRHTGNCLYYIRQRIGPTEITKCVTYEIFGISKITHFIKDIILALVQEQPNLLPILTRHTSSLYKLHLLVILNNPIGKEVKEYETISRHHFFFLFGMRPV